MAAVKIYAGLLEGGWIKLIVKCKSRIRHYEVVDSFRKIPVIRQNKATKWYESSIYYYDEIRNHVLNNGWNFYVTKKLDNYYDRFKLKRKRILEALKNKTFYSKYWTKKKKLQVRSYQAQAINVCLAAKTYIIGDDMGIGKTIEAMAIMCKAFEQGCKRALIVVPSRLKYQWKDEIELFTKFRDISIIDGYKIMPCPLDLVPSFDLRKEVCKKCKLMKKCLKIRQNPNEKRKLQFGQGKIVICNYDILDKSKEFIKRQKFEIMIPDEVSKIKNRSTHTTKAILNIRRGLPKHGFYIPMSGTLIENRLEDIHPSFSFIDKRILGEYYNFKNHYLVFDHWGSVVGYRQEKKLKKIIDPHIIARPIEMVWKDRPPLTEINRTCEMTKLQREIYNDARDGVLKKLNDLKAERKINRADILPLMNYLIQICDSTETQDESIRESGKIDVLKDLIENEIHPRHKVIIFSFFANKVIPIIKRELENYGKSVVIVGGLKSRVFEVRKKKFIKNKDVRFAICSDAMAYGQNMQAATYIINFDLLWNPQKMMQRLRRVYRMGQEKRVTLINLITTGTVEDRMMEVLGERKDLFNKFMRNKVKRPSVEKLLAALQK